MATTIDQINQYFEKSERLNLLQKRIREFIIMLLRNHKDDVLGTYNFNFLTRQESPGLKEGDAIRFQWEIRKNPQPFEPRYEATFSLILDGKEYGEKDGLPSYLIERVYKMLPLIVNTINRSNDPSKPPFNVDWMISNYLEHI